VNTETKLLSRIKYNNEDQVKTKFLGGAGSINSNEFLQKIDYIYDAAGKLTHINTPAEAECFSGQNFCRLSFDPSIFGSQALSCTNVAKIMLGEIVYALPNTIDFSDNGSVDLFVHYISEALDLNGFFGEVSFDEASNKIIITNTNVESIIILLDFCNAKPLEFIVEECCEASDFTPPTELGISTSLNGDLYYQAITYTGLDISRIELASDCTSGLIRNDYVYDANHRITAMNNTIFKHPEIIPGRYNATYSYDLVGNILTLNRKGLVEESTTNPVFGFIDQLGYDYEDGYLKTVADASGVTKGFAPELSTYDYDLNGNLIVDLGKGIIESNPIKYNLLNLPQSIPMSEGTIKHEYTFSGEKIKKEVSGDNQHTRVYLGGIEFVDGKVESYSHGDGRVTFDENNAFHFQYKITDHLGNTVVLFEDTDEDGIINSETNTSGGQTSEVLQRNLYYPFGLAMEGVVGINATTPAMNYLYNGKELNKEFDLNWSDYGARWYDASIGRWGQIDPLAEKYYQLSSYIYVGNNPIRYIDILGMDIFDKNGVKANIEYLKNGGMKITNVDELDSELVATIIATAAESDVGFETIQSLDTDKEKHQIEISDKVGVWENKSGKFGRVAGLKIAKAPKGYDSKIILFNTESDFDAQTATPDDFVLLSISGNVVSDKKKGRRMKRIRKNFKGKESHSSTQIAIESFTPEQNEAFNKINRTMRNDPRFARITTLIHESVHARGENDELKAYLQEIKSYLNSERNEK